MGKKYLSFFYGDEENVRSACTGVHLSSVVFWFT